MPSSFHGKPGQQRRARSHSLKPSPKASARTRSGAVAARATARARSPAPGKTASAAGSATTPNGSAQANRSRVDQERRAQPPKPGEEIAEAPPPARAERGAQRGPARRPLALASAAPSISQTAATIANDKRGHEADRRHRQRADRAGGKRDQPPRPAPGENDVRASARKRRSRSADVDAAMDKGASPSRRIRRRNIARKSARSNDRLRGWCRARRRWRFVARPPARMPRRPARGWIFSRLMRRGSASSTSNSNSPGPATISPRPGTRPAMAVIRPPIVSTSSASARRRKIEADGLGDFVERRARLDEETTVRPGARPADARPRHARPRCRRRSPRRRPRSRRARRCRHIRRSPAPCGCARPASSPAGPAPASRAAQTAPAAGSRRAESGMFMPISTPRVRSRDGACRRFGGARPKRGSEARKSTKSRIWIMPWGSSSVSPKTGRREWPAVRNSASTSLSGVSAATAMMSARGTITSATRTSCSASTFFRIARSCGVKSAFSSAPSSASSMSSRTEPAPRPSSPRRRSNRLPWLSRGAFRRALGRSLRSCSVRRVRRSA